MSEIPTRVAHARGNRHTTGVVTLKGGLSCSGDLGKAFQDEVRYDG